MNVADRLERSQWDLFWVPRDAVIHDRPELLYVSCPRDLPHLNGVTRTDSTHSDLDALVSEVAGAHAAVRSRWLVPSRIASDRLHEALERGGYAATTEHDGRAIEVGAFVPPATAACEVVRVATLGHLRDLMTSSASGSCGLGARSPRRGGTGSTRPCSQSASRGRVPVGCSGSGCTR